MSADPWVFNLAKKPTAELDVKIKNVRWFGQGKEFKNTQGIAKILSSFLKQVKQISPLVIEVPPVFTKLNKGTYHFTS